MRTSRVAVFHGTGQPFTLETVTIPALRDGELLVRNCAVATVAGSLRLAGTLADRTVLIAGAGMLGVTACAMSRVAGYDGGRGRRTVEPEHAEACTTNTAEHAEACTTNTAEHAEACTPNGSGSSKREGRSAFGVHPSGCAVEPATTVAFPD